MTTYDDIRELIDYVQREELSRMDRKRAPEKGAEKGQKHFSKEL